MAPRKNNKLNSQDDIPPNTSSQSIPLAPSSSARHTRLQTRTSRKAFRVDFSAKSPQPLSNLLNKLPPEIRNAIFEIVCVDTSMSYCRRDYPSSLSTGRFTRHRPDPPGFLLACKQIHEECIEMFYDKVTFYFDSVRALRRWNRNVAEGKERAWLGDKWRDGYDWV